jgi:metallo-beta-lactamase class B
MRFGGELVRIVSPGAAHAPDNVVVLLPARGVVFGGCMIKASDAAGFLGHADLDHWEQAVETVRALGARVVIPGHGAVGGAELYDRTIRVVRRERAARARP